MFEITYSDNETFEAYQNAGKAHKGGTYDFTFENRYTSSLQEQSVLPECYIRYWGE